jgi:hypothetical protein
VNGFTGDQAGRLSGVSGNQIRSMVRRGFAAPEANGRWSLRQVIALKVLRDARTQGATIYTAVAAYETRTRPCAAIGRAGLSAATATNIDGDTWRADEHARTKGKGASECIRQVAKGASRRVSRRQSTVWSRRSVLWSRWQREVANGLRRTLSAPENIPGWPLRTIRRQR